ncbi:hypothetical protein SAMN05444395_1331 [Flavobacterium fryxellicola]|uniref:DUF4259 domain-containing protein n=1 Tax=Flavobacterium fryxellicola TaxID=249352 RepID=A0A167VUM8_9FLAO|nr:hypothetical protein [Flavobacterium fryxellicola]OAB26769.1 hypothetical protein FBFR_12715 [Flavobacterium fryxellicola]SHN80475.1 hypothetical protein SAMN05444395_1331 [Flavobacterium fryxellicola]
MGAWGTAISSNDTYADIYSEFFDLYNDGLDVGEISQKLIAGNQETINDTDDCNNFWFALAKAQWECKQLDKEIFDRVKKVIETGADLEVWRQLEADEKDIKKRKAVLDKFLTDLQTERPKAKSRKKKIIRQPIFEKGDCVIFELENKNYGGAIVLEAIKDTELGLNLIALTRINSKAKPLLKDFENSEILTKSFANWKNEIEIGWCYAIGLKTDKTEYEVLGKIKVDINYPVNVGSGYYFNGTIDKMKEYAHKQFEYEKDNPKPPKKMIVKELIKKKGWKFW